MSGGPASGRSPKGGEPPASHDAMSFDGGRYSMNDEPESRRSVEGGMR